MAKKFIVKTPRDPFKPQPAPPPFGPPVKLTEAHKLRDREAEKIEARFERALLKAIERITGRISIEVLANQIASGNITKAKLTLSRADIEEELEPLGRIIETAVIKGIKLGNDDIREMRKKEGLDE